MTEPKEGEVERSVESAEIVPGIEAGSARRTFSDEGLLLGKYCAVVISPNGNYTSQLPAEVMETSGDVTATSIEAQTACLKWNAIIDLEGSYTEGSILVSVSVFGESAPRCEQLRVGLWQVNGSGVLDRHQFCLTDRIKFAREKTESLSLSVKVLFQNLSAGNYCVRVTPVCRQPQECLTLVSRVIELPSAPKDLTPEAPEEILTRLKWLLLLLPLVVFLTATIVLLVHRGRGPSWKAHKDSSTQRPPQLHVGTPLLDPGPPVLRVVYSRDSESHVAAVWKLCELLEAELGMRVVWDEAAAGPAHVTHDWAMAMAQLPCPLFNPEAVQAEGSLTAEKILVLESDGALLKHQAYRRHKDIGTVSESNVDELYHTTYAALLSNQAQALGDYCHIMVARLPYTTLPGRLDLVPEKRYLLPQHLRPLLAALLHGTALPQSRVDTALSSHACRRFGDALAHAANLHENTGFDADSLCGRLQSMLHEPWRQGAEHRARGCGDAGR
ncbi:hypothetical protein V5799_020448 [Amblyomma americanum]|uniref:SEFIR domain-containing protein n=1 Tax=Amblyomma americanum TaxID=6943 RepID=A0AAQ4EU15_AMBAM